jgi:hypothetical protein
MCDGSIDSNRAPEDVVNLLAEGFTAEVLFLGVGIIRMTTTTSEFIVRYLL